MSAVSSVNLKIQKGTSFEEKAHFMKDGEHWYYYSSNCPEDIIFRPRKVVAKNKEA